MKKSLTPKKGISLKQKFLGITIGLLVVSNVTLAGVAIYESQNQMKHISSDTAENAVNTVNSVINADFKEKLAKVEYASKRVHYSKANQGGGNDINSFLIDIAETDDDILLSYVGFEDNQLFTSTHTKVGDDFDVTTREWYKEAKGNGGKAIITEPYEDATGKIVVTIAAETLDKKGVVAVDFDLSALANTTSSVKVGDEGFSFIVSEDGKILTHKDHDFGKDVSGVERFKELLSNDSGSYDFVADGVSKHVTYLKNDITGWKIGANYSKEEISALLQPIFYKAIGATVIILVLASFIIFFAISKLVRPIVNIKHAAEKVADGDLSETLDIKSKDELGQLSEAFNKMVLSLRDMVTSITSTSNNLTHSSEELSASTEENVTSIRQISESIQDVSNSASNQLSSTNHVTKVVQDISNSINDMSDSVEFVNKSSNETSKKADQGFTTIHEAVEQMTKVEETTKNTEKDLKELVETAKKITQFNSTISDIAQQTNLLSLNAAIEASHAGEKGKGFAVVAEEIRKLAEESKEAAKQIDSLINGITTSTENASKSMAAGVESVVSGNEKVLAAGKSFEDIVAEINKLSIEIEQISSTVETVSKGTEEMVNQFGTITNASEEIAGSIDNVASVTEQQNASMEDISEAASSLTTMAEELKQLVQKFNLDK